MDSIAAFLAMGGYARFVWPSFGLTLIVLAGLLVLSLRGLRAAEAELAALQSAAGSRRTSGVDGADEA
jgi:heme exporter protein D